jgi:hypothetical protein
MATYEVVIKSTVEHTYTVKVDADSEDQANELAFDEVWGGGLTPDETKTLEDSTVSTNLVVEA